MKKFIAIYHAPVEAIAQSAEVTPAQHEEAMNRWYEWKSRNSEAVVDFGAPLSAGKAVGKNGHLADSRKEVCGFSIFQGKNEQELRARFGDHPHLDFHPDATIEIHEVLDI